MRMTKIVCTLGPVSSSSEMITKLIRAGMNAARINFSHGSYAEHQEKIDNLKKAREKENASVALVLDTKGPEIRLKDFIEGGVVLKDGQLFVLACGSDEMGTENRAAVSYENLYKKIKTSDTILIDDGKVRMRVEEVLEKNIICRVLNGGRISDKKGINVPNVSLDMEYLSLKDREDILFGIRNDIDYIAASFVRSENDVMALRGFLDRNGGKNIRIISKIENKEGVDNFDRILKLSDGIMVARGDMGVELDLEMLPGIQKRIIRKCREAGKTVITATQMLESMIKDLAPTRAEVTDVANAVYDGTSAVMLSGETAVGAFPVDTVAMMSKILECAEDDLNNTDNMQIDYSNQDADVSEAIGHAACQAAKDLDVKVILAVTQSGYTAEKISKYRPSMPIIAATPNLKTYYQQTLTKGVCPILTGSTDQWLPLMEEAISMTKSASFIEDGDKIVVCAGMPIQKTGNTNLIRIETV